MVVAVFGVPSPFTVLGTQIIRSLIAGIRGACDIISTTKIEDIKESWPQNPKGVICFNEFPEAALIEFLLEERIPIIVFLNGFAATARGLVAERGLAALEAVRTASLSFSCLREAVVRGNVLAVSSHNRLNDAGELLHRIASYLGLRLSEETVLAIIQQLNLCKGRSGRVYLENLNTEMEPGGGVKTANAGALLEAGRLASSLEGYEQLIAGQAIHTIRWPSSIFSLVDKNMEPAIEPVSLVGPARYLVIGPYMGLPRGKWHGSISISVFDNLSGNGIMFDVAAACGADVLWKAEYSLPKAGAYLAELEFHVSHPHLPVEIRSFLTQGAIEGSFRFENVILRPQ